MKRSTARQTSLTAPLPFEESLGFLVRDLNRAIQRALQERIEPQGVTLGAWYFLRVLWEEDGLTQRELASRVGMREPTAVIALRGMEAEGWIKRVRDKEDKRKVHLFLTPKGHALRDRLLPSAYETNEQAAKGLTRDERRTLMSLLRRARANFDPSGPVGA